MNDRDNAPKSLLQRLLARAGRAVTWLDRGLAHRRARTVTDAKAPKGSDTFTSAAAVAPSEVAVGPVQRDAELKSFLQHLLQGSDTFTSAAVIASSEVSPLEPEVTSFICSREVPNARVHVRKLIERMRGYADVLEQHYFGAKPAEPVIERHGPHN